MKIKFKSSELYQAFQVAGLVVPQKSTIPSVTNVKLTVGTENLAPNTLELSATDFEVGLHYYVKVIEVSEEGSLAVPAVRFSGILRESTDETLSLESEGHNCNLFSKDGKYKIQGIDPADFPDVPRFDEKGVTTSIATKDLSEMIRKTQFATATEAIKYALSGQLFEVGDRELRMVASDGRRLAFIKKRATGTPSESKEHKTKQIKAIIPPKAMRLLDTIISTQEENIAVSVEESNIKFKTARASIFSRLIEGSFPDYEAAIPTDRDKKAVLDKNQFLSAIRRIMLLTTEKSRAMKLSFTKTNLALHTRTPDVGEAEIKMNVDYTGDDFEIVFNPEFFSDYLKVVDEDSVELHLKTKDSAGVFKSGKDYIYIVMPLQVNI
jgi:DNA polymerase-3 subunit beta